MESVRETCDAAGLVTHWTDMSQLNNIRGTGHIRNKTKLNNHEDFPMENMF